MKNAIRILRESLLTRLLLGVVVAVPVMVMIKYADESGFGSIIYGITVMLIAWGGGK